MITTRAFCLRLVLTITVGLLLSCSQPAKTGGSSAAASYTVYCIGDSLTYGCPGYNRYEATLSALLGTGYSVVNKGINGNTTAAMLARFKSDLLSHKPDWVIVWGGVNDARTGCAYAITESNLQTMYTQAHNAGTRVVAVNIAPFHDALWTSASQSMADAVNDWIAKKAIDVDFRVDMYAALVDRDNPCYLLPEYDCGDHLHMSDAGYDAAAHAIYDAVDFPLPIAPPAKPRGLAPSDGAVSVSRMPTLRSSTFSDSNIGATHWFSQWQLRETSGSYTSPAYETGTDNMNLTAITIPSGILNHRTPYAWHVRYQSSTGLWSDWSDETAFKTTAEGGISSWVIVVGAAIVVVLMGAVAYITARGRVAKRPSGHSSRHRYRITP